MSWIKTKGFKNVFSKYFVCILIVLFIGTAGVGLWNVANLFPHWIVWEKAAFRDTSGQYDIALKHKKVQVRYANNVIWSTNKDIKVQKALSADIDRDGQDELVLLCWRKGHYGDVKPIWVTEDETDWVQHIFLYELTPEEVPAKWMSSYIGKDVFDITAEVDETLGSLLKLTDIAGEDSVWRWESWGFTRVDIP
jgi:hypothetical protein